ncbi:hypothetical protein KC614_00615 [candidate division WWE3 bacterium]|uniref:Uncharacterized protein n=1 Tax=candidate division WWE3 bacterium TaxID=2053526 RepID=A0A955RQJ2_UNCKA|nr:hypothetical protein [candidate division WWE3 bacterium]
MYHSFGDAGDQPWKRGSSDVRGSGQLRAIATPRIHWSIDALQSTERAMVSSLLEKVRGAGVNTHGAAVAESCILPITQQNPGTYIVEYGSSSAVAWVREDIALLRAVSMLPRAVGVVTLAKGGLSLADSLTDTQASFGLLDGAGDLRSLFTTEQLYRPAGQVPLPRWSDFRSMYRSFGFSASMEIIKACFDVTAARSWFDFVGVYRYVTGQFVRSLLAIPNEWRVVSGEDLFLSADEIAQATVTDFAKTVRDAARIASWQRAPRVLNFPCQNNVSPCDHWHYINARGRQVGYSPGHGADVPKKCRVRSPQQTTVGQAITYGAGLSGMALYYAMGVLGNLSDHVILARDYSKGQVYRVLESFLRDKSNRLHVIPYGATYLYARGSDPAKSLDSLVLLEVLLRSGKPADIVRQIFAGFPVPYKSPHEVFVELDLDGTVTVSHREV